MRKLLLIVGTFVVAGSAGAQTTPTADDIIARYIKTVGGADKIQSIKTLRRVGKYIGDGGLEAIVIQESTRPNIVATFDAWSTKDLAALNTELGTKNLQPIVLITRQDWDAVGKGGQ